MATQTKITKSISLEQYNIKNASVHYQLSPKELQSITVQKGMGKETLNGTLAINTGKFTGRSPEDRFLVKDAYTKDRIWWGTFNKPIYPVHFDMLQKEVENYLSNKELLIPLQYFHLTSPAKHDITGAGDPPPFFYLPF